MPPEVGGMYLFNFRNQTLLRIIVANAKDFDTWSHPVLFVFFLPQSF